MPLSSDQVEKYFERCLVSKATRDQLRQGGDAKGALEAVTILQQNHMAAILFENLGLHYPADRTLPQDTKSVFEHVVTKRRGGTCIQVNLLFAELLRSLGFEVMCTGGRLNGAASIAAHHTANLAEITYGSWVHVNTIVTINDEKYVVDTNFNQFGSPFPVQLVHNQPQFDVSIRQRRMIYESIPTFGAIGQKWWRMQVRDNVSDPWMDVYCFQVVEWLPMDFEIITAGLDKLGVGWFRSLIVCFRVLLEDGHPVGWLMIYQDRLKRCYRGKTEVVQQFFCEDERIRALKDKFGISLTEDERRQIIGSSTELRDEAFDFYG